jgi:hypothetical protein
MPAGGSRRGCPHKEICGYYKYRVVNLKFIITNQCVREIFVLSNLIPRPPFFIQYLKENNPLFLSFDKETSQ